MNVLASFIFSGMTRSAIADASGAGLMEIEHMKKEGYSAEFSCALTAASATIGPIFPPSIPMVIYAMLSGASVGQLFMGGIVPGILLAIFLMVYVGIISNKRKYPHGEIISKKKFLKVSIAAFPALFTVVILLGGLYSGVVTPTEAGALASAYASLISIFIYKTLGIKKLWKVIKKSASNTATLALLAGTPFVKTVVVKSFFVRAKCIVIFAQIFKK